MLKFISNKPNENGSQFEVTVICDDRIQNKKNNIKNKSTKHNLHIKRQKVSVDYRNTSFDDFRIMNIVTTPKLDSEESDIFLVLLVYQE